MDAIWPASVIVNTTVPFGVLVLFGGVCGAASLRFPWPFLLLVVAAMLLSALFWACVAHLVFGVPLPGDISLPTSGPVVTACVTVLAPGPWGGRSRADPSVGARFAQGRCIE